MNKKRIIIIRNSNSDNFGGSDRFPIFLADVLIKNNYEPIIISQSAKILSFARDNNIKTSRGRWLKRQNWNGKSSLLLPVYLIWQIILTFWYYGLFIKTKPNIIHIQSRDDFIAATIAGRLLGKRVIWTDHEELKNIWKNVDRWFKNPVGKLVRFAAKFAYKITVFSESERTLINENIAAGGQVWQKIKVIYNGVIDLHNPYKNKNKDNLFEFCIASHLITDKGIGEAINAFNKLSQDHKNIKLTILGDGPEEVKFREEADGDNNVEFLGHQDDITQYISNADIFLRPTYHEGFSNALVAASMLSCPIIATAVGGNIEIVKNNETGILVHPKDALALYDAMETLYKDKSLREKLANNARKQYEQKFQFDKIVVNDFIPLYENIKK